MRSLLSRCARLATPLLASLLFAAPALADGLIVIPPRVPDQPHLRNIPLAVKYHRVTVTVKGRVAVTEVDQVFVNPNPRRLEGTYLFPLPEGATIDRFSMWLDGKELKAELLDAAKARRVYEDIVRRAQDPALLEYSQNRLFKARIYPIEPHGEKRVRISYAEVISADNGTYAYRYPLNTEKFSSRPLQDASVKVTIEAESPIKAVFSPSHKIDVPREASKTITVGWEERNVTPNRDFLLYWRPTSKDVGISAITYRDDKDPEGTFLLVVSASDAEEQRSKRIPKDVVFVLDTSGSMAGAKMDQAKAALQYCLRSLHPQDRFAVVPFATEARRFRAELANADPVSVKAADAFVGALEARGGTAIDEALASALAFLPSAAESTRPAYVIFVTDGLPTIGESNPDRILSRTAAVKSKPRIFVLGLGNDVNTKLLDRLANQNGGTRDYVAETENIEQKVSNLYAKVANPAMTDVSITLEGVPTSAVHPRKLGDLFHGSELLVSGRYAKPGNVVIRLKGTINGEKVERVEEIRFPEKEIRNPFLPRLWGVRRVGFLLDEIRLRGENQEVKDEVVRLAKRFGIVTPYTSYLILEDEALQPGTASGPRLGGGWDTGSRSGGRDGSRPPPSGGAGGGGAADAEEDHPFADVVREAKKAKEGLNSDSGENSVTLSKNIARKRAYSGDKDDARGDVSGKKSGAMKHVSGRSFLRRSGLWWEVKLDLRKKRRVIEAFSTEYFALLEKNPAIGPVLKLGNVVLTVGAEVIEIRLPR